MTTINPFYNPRSTYSKDYFIYSGPALLTHRGVSVYRNAAGSYDYVHEGMTICQRAGMKKETAPKIINEMLDGQSPHSDAVCAHLRKHGHNAMSYSDYMVLWEAGKVA